MENREQQILSEIKAMMGTIRSQLELLDAKMAELQQCVDPEEFENDPIEVDIDLAVEDNPEVQTLADDDDLPFGDLPSAEMTPEPEMTSQFDSEPEYVSEPDPETEQEEEPDPEQEAEQEFSSEEDKDAEEEQDEDDDDLPGFFDVPETITVAAKASASAKPTINDAHSTDQAWRKDMPGSPVKDIRSAISLNDRVFFINNLFDEDAQAFVNTLSSINSMTSLDEVVDFVTAQYPQWNLNSDVVYRFMMAVRRKVN